MNWRKVLSWEEVPEFEKVTAKQALDMISETLGDAESRGVSFSGQMIKSMIVDDIKDAIKSNVPMDALLIACNRVSHRDKWRPNEKRFVVNLIKTLARGRRR